MTTFYTTDNPASRANALNKIFSFQSVLE